ncbi:MAG: PcfB family protein [Clostridiales bacterium]|nr:PcfB family protein [Clostridiales bacterium]
MNSSGDAAESIVRMSLQGIEVAARISGSGAKNVAALIYTIMKDNQQIKGKTKLVNMLKSGKELKVFSVKKEDLKKFTEEAKRYGVLFSALVDKKSKSMDGMVDIMVRAEDASKINRIVERFNLATVDTALIKSEIQKSKDGKAEADKGIIVKSIEERLVDDILSKPIAKEENEVSNPNVAKMEKSPLSEPTLDNKNKADKGTKTEKPSVREEIKNIKEEQKAQAELEKSDKSKEKKQQKDTQKHKQPKNKKKKSKERGN